MSRSPARLPSRPLVRAAARATACAVSAVLAGTLLVGGGPATAAPAPAGPAADSGRWLVGQLENNRIRNVSFDFVDWGLTIDTYWAMVAAGTRPARAARVIDVVSNHALDYVSFQGDYFAGSVAKLLLARRVAGLPRTVEDPQINLRAQLVSQIGPNGRVKDTGDDDFSSVLSQSLAILALARTGGRVPQDVVDYLIRQQCAPGWFRELLGPRCETGPDEPYVDSTAFAAQALLAAKQSGAHVPAASLSSLDDWLVSAQRRNGSYGSSGGATLVNSNSTGLAAQALAAFRHFGSASAAGDWVGALQLTEERAGGGPAADDLGALAYDRPTLREALDQGITDTTRDVWRRSTPQAQFALRPVPFMALAAG